MWRNPDVRNGLILLAAAVLLWAPRLRGPIDLRFDAGVYYLLGASLADGRGYRIGSEPGDPQAVQYPPLLPALVAAEAKLAGTTDPAVVGRWLRVTYFVLFALYVVTAYAVARLYLGPGSSLLAALLCCLAWYGFFLSDLLFAELPFALATTVFALCHHRGARAPTPRGRVAWGAGAAACAVAAYLLRTAGVALLAAWVGESLLRRQWRRAALRAAVAALPIVGWQAYLGQVTGGEAYERPAYAYQRAAYQFYNVTYARNILLVDPFVPERGVVTPGGLAERVGSNLVMIPRGLGESVSASAEFGQWLLTSLCGRLGLPSTPPVAVVAAPLTLVGCLVVLGAVLLLRRGEWLVPIYLIMSVGLICLTPWPRQFGRYLSPLNPFLALCFVTALTSAWAAARRHSRWLGRATVAGAALLVAVAVGVQSFALLATYAKRFTPAHAGAAGRGGDATAAAGQRLFYYDDTWGDLDAAVEWLDAHARPTDVIATAAPHWLYLKTGRKAVMPPMEADPTLALALLDSVPAAFVVVDEMEFIDVARRYALPAIASRPDAWRRVYTAPGGRAAVYERVPATAGASSGGGGESTP